MSRSRLRSRRIRARVLHRRLEVELLEDRSLLDAALASLTAGYDPRDILVRLRTDAATFTMTGSEKGTAVGLDSSLWKIELGPGVTVANALAVFQADPRVAFAQPDYKIQLQQTPNDPYFTGNMQWALNKIGAPAGWNNTTGSSNVIVAVIDTGIDYNDTDLRPNIWTNPGPVANDGIGNDIHGANFTSLTTTTGNVLDDNGHGTHVAGIIGAVGNNGFGVAGVDWHVQLMDLKFLDAHGTGYTSGAVRAIDYAIAHGASIINASWAGGGYDQALSDAIGRAAKAGVIVVAAAGNAGQNDDVTPTYPADYHYDNVVTVAASDQNDNRAWFSNYGPNTVDLYAPGVGIWSTTPNNTFTSLSGTSMAAPFVTGALALLKSEHPTWDYHQLISRLESTVDKLPQLSNVAWGGRLDLAAALAPIAPPVTPPIAPPIVPPVSSPPPVTVSPTLAGTRTFTNATPAPITGMRTTISRLALGASTTIGSLAVKVNINYSWDGDLYIHLRGPDGTDVVLFNRRGGSGQNINATFADSAAMSIRGGRAPFNGSYRPEQALAAFQGKNTRGVWQLIVEDRATGDQGTLNSWSLVIQPAATPAARSASMDGESSSPARSLADNPGLPSFDNVDRSLASFLAVGAKSEIRNSKSETSPLSPANPKSESPAPQLQPKAVDDAFIAVPAPNDAVASSLSTTTLWDLEDGL
jgi:subtilisin-like proprotein convertase family protein